MEYTAYCAVRLYCVISLYHTPRSCSTNDTGYIDWLFTTPLLLVSLAFLGGLSPFDGIIVILFDIGMIVTGLLGGVTPARWHDGEKARWAFFAVSCLFFLGIWYILLVNGAQGMSFLF